MNISQTAQSTIFQLDLNESKYGRQPSIDHRATVAVQAQIELKSGRMKPNLDLIWTQFGLVKIQFKTDLNLDFIWTRFRPYLERLNRVE